MNKALKENQTNLCVSGLEKTDTDVADKNFHL